MHNSVAFYQMATKPLSSEAIALTEKKMDMTLGMRLIFGFFFFFVSDFCLINCLLMGFLFLCRNR